MADLLAGAIGLVIGLLIATLLAYPISRLPPPFGTILPFVGVIIFGYLGMTALVTRQREFFKLFGIDATAGATGETDAQWRSTACEPSVLLLDTSVIIDGRIADIANTGFLARTVAGSPFCAQRTAIYC